MTLTDHLADDTLSALLDEQLAPAELSAARAHVELCASCAERLAELRQVVGLLRGLPLVQPSRDFTLGPRLVDDPLNVIRLQRWYTWARAGAASLAAVFVLLAAGSIYVDNSATSRTASSVLVANDAPKVAATSGAPAPAQAVSRDGAAAPAAPQVAVRAQPAAGAAAESALAKATPEASDQVAAATSVRALPTQIPVPTPAPVAALAPTTTGDPAAPLRIAAFVAGALAIVAVLLALYVRQRLVRSRAPNLIPE
ncbi:MAG TPA: hypothetical protein VFG86_26820 [Chloroflexota bacterium]|nr:hypothetical protein [Chloroflexota bacterium]